jgi:hypothetical protein
VQVIAAVAGASTLKPSASSGSLVTSTGSPVAMSVHTARFEAWVTRVKPSFCCSVTVTVAVDDPPAYWSGKFTAPVPETVVPDCSDGVTPGLEVLASKVQPPEGVAPVTVSPVVEDGTTCLTTLTDPLHVPSARSRRASPASA